MAEGNQVGTFLGGLNTGDTRHRQNIALFVASAANQCQSFRLHPYQCFSRSLTVGNGLASHIHHVGIALVIQVGQFAHVAQGCTPR